jgi:hypothetical protein
MKHAVFWDATACDSCKNRRFGGTYRLHQQGGKIRELGDKAVSSLLILCTLLMEVIRSSETSVLERATRRHIPEDGIILLFHFALNVAVNFHS